MAERYFSEQKFLVRTPLGDLLVWCEESSGRYDVPTIHVDYIHKDGNIPLLKTDYDYVSNTVYTEIFEDMYKEDPTTTVTHKDINRLYIKEN